MHVEMALEGQVVGIALVVFAAVVAYIRCRAEPLLEVGQLLLGRILAVSHEGHLIGLSIGGDEHQVVATSVVAVDVVVVDERIG